MLSPAIQSVKANGQIGGILWKEAWVREKCGFNGRERIKLETTTKSVISHDLDHWSRTNIKYWHVT